MFYYFQCAILNRKSVFVETDLVIGVDCHNELNVLKNHNFNQMAVHSLESKRFRDITSESNAYVLVNCGISVLCIPRVPERKDSSKSR